MPDRIYNISTDFSLYPGGRFRKDGAHSGEELRQVLAPILKRQCAEGGRLIVVLDGTMGYSASFLEEAFGGLVRSDGFSAEALRQSMVIEAENPVYAPYKQLAERYITEALASAAA